MSQHPSTAAGEVHLAIDNRELSVEDDRLARQIGEAMINGAGKFCMNHSRDAAEMVRMMALIKNAVVYVLMNHDECLASARSGLDQLSSREGAD
jgi:hypothetical protein